jgi:hypothetical protein
LRGQSRHCSANRARVAIVDLPSVHASALSSGFVQRLANRKPAKADVKCFCFIVDPEGDVYGLCRRFQLWEMSRRPRTASRTHAGEVFAAIGIRSPSFEPSVALHYSEPNNTAHSERPVIRSMNEIEFLNSYNASALTTPGTV